MLNTPLRSIVGWDETEVFERGSKLEIGTERLAEEYNALAEKVREIEKESLQRIKILDALEAEVKKLREERKECPTCSK